MGAAPAPSTRTRRRRSSIWRWLPAVVLGSLGCGPVQLTCNVCGEEETFPTCQELYCRYLSAAGLCATRDLQECFSRYDCPSPYFLFCPADTRDE